MCIFQRQETSDVDGFSGDNGIHHLLAAILDLSNGRVMGGTAPRMVDTVISTADDPQLRQQRPQSAPLRVPQREFPPRFLGRLLLPQPSFHIRSNVDDHVRREVFDEFRPNRR